MNREQVDHLLRAQANVLAYSLWDAAQGEGQGWWYDAMPVQLSTRQIMDGQDVTCHFVRLQSILSHQSSLVQCPVYY